MVWGGFVLPIASRCVCRVGVTCYLRGARLTLGYPCTKNTRDCVRISYSITMGAKSSVGGENSGRPFFKLMRFRPWGFTSPGRKPQLLVRGLREKGRKGRREN